MELLFMKKINVRGPGKLKQTTIRQVRKIGKSLYLCLPKPYCEKNDIEAGTEMAVVMGGQILRIMKN